MTKMTKAEREAYARGLRAAIHAAKLVRRMLNEKRRETAPIGGMAWWAVEHDRERWDAFIGACERRAREILKEKP